MITHPYNPTLRKLRQEDRKFRPAWGTYRIPVLNMYVMPGICQARPGVSLRPRASHVPVRLKSVKKTMGMGEWIQDRLVCLRGESS